MKYNLLDIEDIERFNFDCQKFKDFGSSVELKKIQHNRTITQNKALHLYFTVIFPSYESWATSELIKKYEVR